MDWDTEEKWIQGPTRFLTVKRFVLVSCYQLSRNASWGRWLPGPRCQASVYSAESVMMNASFPLADLLFADIIQGPGAGGQAEPRSCSPPPPPQRKLMWWHLYFFYSEGFCVSIIWRVLESKDVIKPETNITNRTFLYDIVGPKLQLYKTGRAGSNGKRLFQKICRHRLRESKTPKESTRGPGSSRAGVNQTEQKKKSEALRWRWMNTGESRWGGAANHIRGESRQTEDKNYKVKQEILCSKSKQKPRATIKSTKSFKSPVQR